MCTICHSRSYYRTKMTMLIPAIMYGVCRLFVSPADILGGVRTNSEPSPHIFTDRQNVSTITSDRSSRYITNRNYMFNCSTIDHVILKRKLGEGVSKQGFLGEFKGRTVVVKLSRTDLTEIPRCIRNLFPVGDVICPQYSRMKIMKEIFILKEIAHPTVAPLLGYCARGGLTQADGLTDRGFISVVEWGDDVTENKLLAEHWSDRLKHAQDIAEIMQYLANSPIGSIQYPDFQVRHFKVFNDTIKIIDLDMVYNKEPSCHSDTKCHLHIDCVAKICIGYNAKYNLDNMNKFFISALYNPSTYPANVSSHIDELKSELKDLKCSAGELVEKLNVIRTEFQNLK